MNQLQNHKKTSPFAMIHIISKEKIKNYFNKSVINNLISYIKSFEINECDYIEDNNSNPLLNEIACSFNSLLEETELGKLMLNSLSHNNNQELCNRFNEIQNKMAENYEEQINLSWESYMLLIKEFLKLSKIINKKNKIDDQKTGEFNEIIEKILKINTQIYITDLLLIHSYKKAIQHK